MVGCDLINIPYYDYIKILNVPTSMYQLQCLNIVSTLKTVFRQKPQKPPTAKNSRDRRERDLTPPKIPKNPRHRQKSHVNAANMTINKFLHPLNIPSHFFYYINNCIRINIIWYGNKNLCWYKVFFFDAHIDLGNELASDDVIN